MIIRINIPGFVLQGRPLHPRRVRGAASADGVRPHHRGDRAQRPRVQREPEQCHRPVNRNVNCKLPIEIQTKAI